MKYLLPYTEATRDSINDLMRALLNKTSIYYRGAPCHLEYDAATDYFVFTVIDNTSLTKKDLERFL